MASERLEKYLATLERRPAITDEQTVRHTLSAAGVPCFDAVVDFDCKYAGYVQQFGFGEFIWGLFHEIPHECSYFDPGQPRYEFDEGQHCFDCCNCHASYPWYLDDNGGLHYMSEIPMAMSFENKLERDAVSAELHSLGKSLYQLSFDDTVAELLPKLIPRLKAGLIVEASDQYETLYLHDNVYADIKDGRLFCAILGSKESDLLDGLPFIVVDP